MFLKRFLWHKYSIASLRCLDVSRIGIVEKIYTADYHLKKIGGIINVALMNLSLHSPLCERLNLVSHLTQVDNFLACMEWIISLFCLNIVSVGWRGLDKRGSVLCGWTCAKWEIIYVLYPSWFQHVRVSNTCNNKGVCDKKLALPDGAGKSSYFSR